MDKRQSKDFRYVFANAFRVRIADNDITLTLGMHEGGDPENMFEEVAVVMTPKTLKIILNNLRLGLEALESQIGEIVVPAEKIPGSLEELIRMGGAKVETDSK